MQSEKNRFRVVIVGGSVAGLILAHCLWKNNIDFVILESHYAISFQSGASIGIFPNGARIIDQLGMFDEILEATEPLRRAFAWSDAGKMASTTDFPRVVHKRHGYPISFIDRQLLLQILYDNLKSRQNRVHTNKKVTHVEYCIEKVRVHCADQSVFEGDIVVGTDGVRSIVRQEMWRYMDSVAMSEQASKERALIPPQYSCVSGISNATKGLTVGESHCTFADGYSSLAVVGKEGRVLWTLLAKMNRTYSASEISRFNSQDVEKDVKNYFHIPITGSVPFSALCQNAVTKSFLVLEETLYTHWCVGRFVCIGDLFHEMTPNMGQGCNSALEDAASMANHLATLVQDSSSGNIPLADLKGCLAKWQEARKRRTKRVCSTTNKLTQLERAATLKDSIFSEHSLPVMGGYFIDMVSGSLIGAERLNCVPLPPRSSQCSMPFHLLSERGYEDTIWGRALWTAPLVGCYFTASLTMGMIIQKLWPLMVPLFELGSWTASNGETLSLITPIYHMSFLDRIFGPLITCFLPSISGSDPRSYAQMISFMADIGPVYGIWLLESFRKGNSRFETMLPMFAGTASQLMGIGQLAPLYYAIEYIRTPLSNLLHSDQRDIKTNALNSLFPAILAGYYLPTFASFFASTVESRRSWNSVWQLFPVVVPLLQLPFCLFTKPASEAKLHHDLDLDRNKKMFPIRCTYAAFAAISGLTFLYARISAPEGMSLASIFVPSLGGHTESVSSFAEGIARFLQYDEIFSMASGFVWLGLRFRELKQSGIQLSWWKPTCALVGTCLTLGPGAAFALGWGWKEEVTAWI